MDIVNFLNNINVNDILNPNVPVMPNAPVLNFDGRKTMEEMVEGSVLVNLLPAMSEKVCEHCGALLFSRESKNFCCREGKIELAPLNEHPASLLQMFQTDEAFKRDVRKYNSAFSFTSMGVNVDNNLASARNGIYTFRISGQLHHHIGSLLPQQGEQPKFAQIYFHDDREQVERRLELFPGLNQAKIETIGTILQNNNPYVNMYRQSRHQINAAEVSLQIFSRSNKDRRRYNTPTAAEVAVLIHDGQENAESRDIILKRHDNSLKRISEINAAYDPLQYPLLFPRGEQGWHPGIPYSNGNGQKKVTLREYIVYYLMVRNSNKVTNSLHLGGRLFQQYLVDMYAKYEQNNLNYLRKNQSKIRAELYQGLADAVGNALPSQIGTRIVLPSSFTGGPRYMMQRYQDAMSIVRELGKPDLFVTMTCNPNWPEIQRELLPGQSAQDRPDIVARVFREKLRSLCDELFVRNVLGKVGGYIYVVEFQKRGLPHAHLLIILENASKLQGTNHFDQVVSAEIPDPVTQPTLYASVSKHMIHGPCGTLNPQSVCMCEGRCSKSFPKAFQDETAENDDGFPLYQRRNNGRKVVKVVRGRNVEVDNRFVVPYNPYLLLKFDCHINVEICCSISSVKYLYKYVYKGHDRAEAVVADAPENGNVNGTPVNVPVQVDEIKNYLDCRYVSAAEACWRLFELPMFHNSHSIVRLPIHLPGQNVVVFSEEADLGTVLANAGESKLTKVFYTLCVEDEFARNITYQEYPKHYVWKEREKKWAKRQKRSGTTIARMYTVSPSEGERFYLRILLINVKGPTSFENLRTVNNVVYPTFQDAAVARGLVANDVEYDNCLVEASLFSMPKGLRQLFCTILIFCNPANVGNLYLNHRASMMEDFIASGNSEAVSEALLCHAIRQFLEGAGKSYNMFPQLPEINEDLLDVPAAANGNLLISEELNYSANEIAADVSKIPSLSAEQRSIFDRVIASALGTSNQKCFFIDGPGGSGKTFTYSAIIGRLRSMGKIVIVVASSGIAAYLLQGGRTAHSRFKIPLHLASDSLCRISKNSHLCALIRQASLIVWDEAPMTDRRAFEAVDRTFRDLMDLDEPFGGKTILLGGDFRQILPVVVNGTRAATVAASIKASYLWPFFHRASLTSNFRTGNSNLVFIDWLISIGNGTYPKSPEIGDDYIRLDNDLLIQGNSVSSLLDEIFPNINDGNDPNFFMDRVILTPRNKDVDLINSQVLDRLNGEIVLYESADSIDDSQGEELEQIFPTEFLNSITPNGLPEHKLKLKIGMPIMLLRNLNPREGLCNGTRLIVKELREWVIDAEIATGKFKGKRVFIPRITLSPSSTTLPFILKRRQFPIRPCFAMTINKSQGQTLQKVGLFLPTSVFSHGQLYVALSRVKRKSDIKILILETFGQSNVRYTKNIVYPEAL